MTNKTIGIFVDAENLLNPTIITPIVRTASNSGSLSALLLFGNWNSPALASWSSPQIKQELCRWGAVWSPLPQLRPGKNAADIALTYEAALLARNGTVNEIWIVSGDSDFTPLVERLQQKRIRVVIFGPKNTPPNLRNACSSFVLLDDLQNGIQTVTANTCSSSQPSAPRVQRAQTFAQNIVESLRTDGRGWFHGFVRHGGSRFGFIQVSPQHSLFFCANTVDAPMAFEDLRNGDPVEFKLGRNHKGFVAVHVRKTFALRTA